jgi:NADP-dependent aldehyde dehydrogenase
LDLMEFLPKLEGQLTATIHANDDEEIALKLASSLGSVAGRIIWNQWPTGVSVTWAMHHGGPYPATTCSLNTSVGAAAIKRFLRPISYQNCPEALLPLTLRESNPWQLPRRIDGVWNE